MRRTAFALFVLFVVAGCTLHSKTEVVRGAEEWRSVRYESPEAQRVFEDAVAEAKFVTDSTQVSGRFLTVYNRTTILSESAKFNDAVLRTDTNRDGVITEFEARTFATRTE